MPEPPKPPLTYERPASSCVPRWQFRLLFLVVLLNLGITIQMAYAPGVGAAVKQWVSDRREKRRVQALQKQAKSWTQPAGTVVWEDDPDAAAKLRATGAYNPTPVPAQVRYGNYPFLAGWPPGATAPAPALAAQLQRNFPIYDDEGRIPQRDDGWAVLLFHGLKSQGGKERLVYVIVEGRSELAAFGHSLRREATPTEPQSGSVERRLRLIAVALQPRDGVADPRPQPGQTTELVIAPGGTSPWKSPWRWTPPADGKPAELRLEPLNQFRFFAGQPDPADPSHFTVDYELDGVKGKIQGRLKDDGVVELKPEGGTVSGQRWDPRN
jgi:hypothetical protein